MWKILLKCLLLNDEIVNAIMYIYSNHRKWINIEIETIIRYRNVGVYEIVTKLKLIKTFLRHIKEYIIPSYVTTNNDSQSISKYNKLDNLTITNYYLNTKKQEKNTKW